MDNKKNIIITILALAAGVLILYTIYQLFSTRRYYTYQQRPVYRYENFDVKTSDQDINHQPDVNPKSGAILDGPGYERSQVDGVDQDVMAIIPSNYYFLDDGSSGEMSIQHNLCSKSCCSAQWPTPFKQKYDPYVCGARNADGTPVKFVPSNIMCNNSFEDSGCLCLTQEQSKFLYNRGGNGRELF